MPGQSYRPLELYGEMPEAERFREAACEGDPIDEVIGLTLLDTGVRTSEIVHMNPGWLVDGNDEELGIRIPLGDKCQVGTGPAEEGLNTHKKGKPCFQCRDQPLKSWAPPDADWRPKTRAAQRYIPIKEVDTRQVVRAYFNLNDVVASHQTVLKRVKRIARKAGIQRNVTPYDLRNTFGTKLADKGFSAHEIKNLMGHASLEPATHYVKLSSKAMQGTFDEKW